MRLTFERNVRWIKFVINVFGYVAVVNLFVLPILWISNILSPVIFVYEGVFLCLWVASSFFSLSSTIRRTVIQQ